MSAPPRVVVSVVSWNTADLTLRCLASLRRLGDAHEVVVVDNDSGDDTLSRVAREHPQVAILRSPVNVGFAAAHALARDWARSRCADAIWLLNSDAQPEPDALGALLAAWREHGDGLYCAAPLRTDSAGRTWLDLPARLLDAAARWRPARRDTPIAFGADWRARGPVRLAAPLGSALLVPMAVADRYGWMEPDWFMYCEELDWGLRLREAGVASWLVPRARVAHAGGGSLAQRPRVADAIAYYRARNEIALARRHAGRGAILAVALKKTLRGLATLAARPARGAMLLRGVVDALRGRRGRTVAPERFLPQPWTAESSLLARLRRRLARGRDESPRCIVDTLGEARLIHAAEPPAFLRAYARYVIALFAAELRRTPRRVALQFEPCDADCTQAPAPLRVGWQWEHTLVRPGGRDSAGAPRGTIPVADGGDTYLVRVDRLEALRRCDLVIEYSQPNLENLRSSGAFDALLRRCVHVAPLPHPPDLEAGGRDQSLLTLMHDTGQSRRARFLRAARRAGLPLRNVRGVYAPEALRALFRRTRVLVNLHQTDDHHTFEELRVLPALAAGAIVISEDVPLRDHIPYADFIVWCRYGELVDTTRAVLADYAAVRARTVGDPRLPAVLEAMHRANQRNVAGALQAMADRLPLTASRSDRPA